ncbi:uncharacterized protein LOC144119764 [Amblyomma americanum]
MGAKTTNVYYMPHQPVFRSESTTTRLRVVFDASSHAPDKVSLNDHLEKGPKLIGDLVRILVRFRLHEVALVADIEKAFLQIGVRPEDRDALRFLWYRSTPVAQEPLPSVEEWIMSTLLHHFDKQKGALKETAGILKDSFYVDDLVTGAKSEHEALKIATEAAGIVRNAGMRLRKWMSNSITVRKALRNEDCGASEETQKVLGLHWTPTTDRMGISLAGVLNTISTENTKRGVLQASASVFDPLGLVSPFVIRAKILFQRMWERGIEWDEQLPSDLKAEWTSWCSDLSSLRQLCFPRCTAPNDQLSWQLHIFCDASPTAYGCCAYLRIGEDSGTVIVNLILAKSRVAPLKALSLPRLELMAAVIGTRMATYRRGAIDHQLNVSFLTDSMITLHWIRSTAKNWKPFVQNRVTEIQSASNPESWRHYPGSHNPADCLTRGMKAESLCNSKIWWHGPEWLEKSASSWPKTQSALPCSPEVVAEERKR